MFKWHVLSPGSLTIQILFTEVHDVIGTDQHIRQEDGNRPVAIHTTSRNPTAGPICPVDVATKKGHRVRIRCGWELSDDMTVVTVQVARLDLLSALVTPV